MRDTTTFNVVRKELPFEKIEKVCSILIVHGSLFVAKKEMDLLIGTEMSTYAR